MCMLFWETRKSSFSSIPLMCAMKGETHLPLFQFCPASWVFLLCDAVDAVSFSPWLLSAFSEGCFLFLCYSEICSPFSHPCSRYLDSPSAGRLFENCQCCHSFKLQISPMQEFCFVSEMIAVVKGLFPWWLNWAGIGRDLFNHLCQQNSLQQMLPLWDEKFTWMLFWLRSSNLWRSGPL